MNTNIVIVFGLTRPGIESESTASVVDALSTRPLIGLYIGFMRQRLLFSFECVLKIFVCELIVYIVPYTVLLFYSVA